MAEPINLKWLWFPYRAMVNQPPKICEADRHADSAIPAEFVEMMYNSPEGAQLMVIRQVWHTCEACHLDLGFLTDDYQGMNT